MDFFDRSFLDLVKRLVPARVNFRGAEFVVESHMIERPKVQYGFRPPSIMSEPSGSITIYLAHNTIISDVMSKISSSIS